MVISQRGLYNLDQMDFQVFGRSINDLSSDCNKSSENKYSRDLGGLQAVKCIYSGLKKIGNSWEKYRKFIG